MSISSLFRIHEGKPYHPLCAAELFDSRCTVCSNELPEEYARHLFFQTEKICPGHSEDDTKKCRACERYE